VTEQYETLRTAALGERLPLEAISSSSFGEACGRGHKQQPPRARHPVRRVLRFHALPQLRNGEPWFTSSLRWR
jgi:hypothetical protein